MDLYAVFVLCGPFRTLELHTPEQPRATVTAWCLSPPPDTNSLHLALKVMGRDAHLVNIYVNSLTRNSHTVRSLPGLISFQTQFQG